MRTYSLRIGHYARTITALADTGHIVRRRGIVTGIGQQGTMTDKPRYSHSRHTMVSLERTGKARKSRQRSLANNPTDSGVAAQTPTTAALDASAVLTKLPTAIYTTDAHGCITFYNEMAVALWGRRPAIGEDYWCGSWKLYWPDGTPMPHDQCPLAEMLQENPDAKGGEVITERPDGSRVPLLTVPTALTDGGGNVVGALNMLVDITAQKEQEARVRLLMREVNHRVRNHCQVILAMIRETNARAKDPTEFEERITERIMGLAHSQDLLVASNWGGATVADLMIAQIKLFAGEHSYVVSGPTVFLKPHAVQYLGVAFHELATNSAKYGAFSGNQGRVEARWEIERGSDETAFFVLRWSETGGRQSSKPIAHGFGRTILERVTPLSLQGEAEMNCDTLHMFWRLRAPLENVGAAVDGEQTDGAQSTVLSHKLS
jgi:PAS domain S-box-containing protein